MTAAEKTKAEALIELAERCEKVTGQDFELDGQIKLAVAAWMIAGGSSKDEVVAAVGGDLYADPMLYSTSLDAALTLVDELWQGGRTKNGFWCQIPGPAFSDQFRGNSKANQALAICAAALRARAAMEK